MDSVGVTYRRQGNQSVQDKKKKKKRKKKPREGKRSSASSASASGTPDSNGPRKAKAQASQSCPSLVGNDKNGQSENTAEELKVNECLRWPAHSLYIENSFRTDLIKRFPVSGLTEDEENERIAIYKMNRRKRYLAAQQALINKYPDIGVYASSSGSSAGHRQNEEERRISISACSVPPSDAKSRFHSEDVSLDVISKEDGENARMKYFSNGDDVPCHTKTGSPILNAMPDNRKKVLSGV